jgi:hypothetical protein
MELKVATDIIYEGLINIEGKPPSLVVSWYHISIGLIGVGLFFYWKLFLAKFIADFLAKYKRKMFVTFLILLGFNILVLFYPYLDSWLPTHVVYGWEDGLSAHFFLGQYHLKIIIGLLSVVGFLFIVSTLFFGSGLAIYSGILYQLYHLYMLLGFLETGARVPFDGVIYKTSLYGVYYVFSRPEKTKFLTGYLYDKDEKRLLWNHVSLERQNSFLDEQMSPKDILEHLDDILSTVELVYFHDIFASVALGVVCLLGFVALCIIGSQLVILSRADTYGVIVAVIPKFNRFHFSMHRWDVLHLDNLYIQNWGVMRAFTDYFRCNFDEFMKFVLYKTEWKVLLMSLLVKADQIRSVLGNDPADLVLFDGSKRLWVFSKYLLDTGFISLTPNEISVVFCSFLAFARGILRLGDDLCDKSEILFKALDLLKSSPRFLCSIGDNSLYTFVVLSTFL